MKKHITQLKAAEQGPNNNKVTAMTMTVTALMAAMLMVLTMVLMTAAGQLPCFDVDDSS